LYVIKPCPDVPLTGFGGRKPTKGSEGLSPTMRTRKYQKMLVARGNQMLLFFWVLFITLEFNPLSAGCGVYST